MRWIVLVPQKEVLEATRTVNRINRTVWSRPGHEVRPDEVDQLLRAHDTLTRVLAAQGKTVLQ